MQANTRLVGRETCQQNLKRKFYTLGFKQKDERLIVKRSRLQFPLKLHIRSYYEKETWSKLTILVQVAKRKNFPDVNNIKHYLCFQVRLSKQSEEGVLRRFGHRAGLRVEGGMWAAARWGWEENSFSCASVASSASQHCITPTAGQNIWITEPTIWGYALKETDEILQMITEKNEA